MAEITINRTSPDAPSALPAAVLANNGPTVEIGGLVVPTKFVKDGVIDTAALVKSYTHLEKMKGKQATAPVAPATGAVGDDGDSVPAAAVAPLAPVVADGAKPAPVAGSWTNDEATAWATEINAGGLTEESYTTLAERGFSKEVVDTFVAGQKAIAVQGNEATYALVGGEEAYAGMIAWAGRNIDKAEALQFNAALKTDGRAMAVKGLWARHRADAGVQFIGGSNERGASAYANQMEMMTDIKDPRYQTDAAFRARVQSKVERAKF